MKYIIIFRKVILAVALLFIPSIMMADKIEIQDSTVIVVGKGQTNKKGVFTAIGSIRIDSIFIDEIVLTYKGRAKGKLIIVDSVSNQPLFSKEVTNGMSKNEMINLRFSLLAGHTYVIKHGNNKKWNIIIPSSQSSDAEIIAADTTKNDTIEKIENTGGKTDETNNSRSSWLYGFIIGFAVASVILFFYKKYRYKKNTKQEQIMTSGSTLPEKFDDKSKVEREIQKDIKAPNVGSNPDISKQESKEKRRLEKLKRIAILLGLKDDQLTLIESKIEELQKIANQNHQIVDAANMGISSQIVSEPRGCEDIYTVQEEVAKELVRKFEQRKVFTEAIENAKKKCYVKEPKCSEILNYLIDEIANTLRNLSNQIVSASEKNREPINDTADVVGSESYTQWLNKRLKELFEFSYDEKLSVKQNIEQLISELTKTTSDSKAPNEETLNSEIEQLVNEKLTRLKEKWEADAKRDKENALAAKDTEMKGLRGQLNEMKGKITNLQGQIEGKDRDIIKQQTELDNLKNSRKQELQNEVKTLVDKLHRCTNAIEWRPMLEPCNNDDTTLSQCADIESRLNEKLREMKERLTAFTTAENAVPEETRIAIQKILMSEITIDESVVNSLCRLFAYSNLAFMTDAKREYGVRLRRKNVHEVYEALENLYIQFGIKFQIPPLFVMESKDRDYVNVTGQAYSELGNLCPNVSNHCDNIDSNMRLKDIIVDIDRIGYTIDGSVQSNARILTF